MANIMKNLYGVDLSKKVTPLVVRDAIILCFYEAHCAETGISSKEKNPANREYCRAIIKKAFTDANGDFDKPTKQAILDVLDYLADFSKNFRDPGVIEKHYSQIMTLVDRLDE